MTWNVHIIRDPFDPVNSTTVVRGATSVREAIQSNLHTWPAGARIYAGAISQERDVTPRVPEDVVALEDISSPDVFVVIYPEGPVEIILGILLVLTVAAALFLMPNVALPNRQAQSPSKQLSNRENSARPNGRIPDIYGKVRAYPDLIAAPYTLFISHQEVEVSYMCLGRGEFEVHDVRDDTTAISTIDGASVEIYGPDTSPNSGSPVQTIGSAIGRPVLTSKRINSVNGQVLEPSVWVGPYTVELRDMDRIQVNIVAQRGMFKDDGDQTSTSVAFEVEVQPVDDAGRPVGSVLTGGTTIVGSATDQDIKAATVVLNFPAPSRRATVRVRRTTPLNTSFEGTVVDEIKWRDCYGMYEVTNSDFGGVTTVMAQTYATANALAIKNRRLNMLVTRKLPQRDGEYGFTTSLTATRSAADALCAMSLDPVIGRMTGGTLPPAGSGQIDVPQIYAEVEAVKDYFGIDEVGEFNYVFDDDNISYQEMAQTVAATVFCQAYRRGSILRISLERPQEDSTLLLNHRNVIPDSESRTYTFGIKNEHDGVSVDYVDPSDDTLVRIYVPQGDDSAVNPLRLQNLGIRGFEMAYLHAWRAWNRLRYHYLSVNLEALQEADMLIRDERVLVADGTRVGVMDGEVVAQAGLVLTLSQPVELDPLKDYTCFLQLPSGLVEGVAVIQGSTEYEVILEVAPAEALSLGLEVASPTKFVISEDNSDARPATPMLVTEKDPGDGLAVSLTLINYDDRYYENDLDFLTEEGEGGTDPSDPDVVEGEPDPGVTVGITPPLRSTESFAPSSSGTFTATASGGTPSSYLWGVFSGPGTVISQSGASATLRITDSFAIGAEATFFCDITIAGVVYRAYCNMHHFYNSDGRPIYDGIGIEP